MIIKAYNIRYDTEGRNIRGLPSTMSVEVEDEDEVADAISDSTGWCVLGFDLEVIPGCVVIAKP